MKLDIAQWPGHIDQVGKAPVELNDQYIKSGDPLVIRQYQNGMPWKHLGPKVRAGVAPLVVPSKKKDEDPVVYPEYLTLASHLQAAHPLRYGQSFLDAVLHQYKPPGSESSDGYVQFDTTSRRAYSFVDEHDQPDHHHVVGEYTAGPVYDYDSSLVVEVDSKHKWVLAPGVHAIVAPPKSGKTRFVMALADLLRESCVMIRSGERELGSFPHPRGMMGALATASADFDVVIVDSLREEIFRSDGSGTLATGLAPGIFQDLAAWAGPAQRAGTVIIVVLTPIDTDDQRQYPMMLAALEGVVTSYLEVGSRFRIYDRTLWTGEYLPNHPDAAGGGLVQTIYPWASPAGDDPRADDGESATGAERAFGLGPSGNRS